MEKQVEQTKSKPNQQIMDAIANAVTSGNLGGLSPEGRMFYYNQVCESVGLNPLTRPLDFLQLNGKTVLYARKDATDQLRKIHSVSITKLETVIRDGLCEVTACARDKDGKEDSDLGVVVLPAGGEARANALMKAATKAKRRVTLSICGMGILDESEFDTVPEARAQMQNGNAQAATAAKTEALKERLGVIVPQASEIPPPIPEAAKAKPAISPSVEAEALPPKKLGRPPGLAAKARAEAIAESLAAQPSAPPTASPGPTELATPSALDDEIDEFFLDTETAKPSSYTEIAIWRLANAKSMEALKEAWNQLNADAKDPNKINLSKLPAPEASAFVENAKKTRDQRKAEISKQG